MTNKKKKGNEKVVVKQSNNNNINNNNNSETLLLKQVPPTSSSKTLVSQTEKNIEFDKNGKEICFLFRKFGKCRFGDKCKKSHLLNTSNPINVSIRSLLKKNNEQLIGQDNNNNEDNAIPTSKSLKLQSIFTKNEAFVFFLLKSVMGISEDDSENKWLITVGNTLISILQRNDCNEPYHQIEKRLVEWGFTDINARKLTVLIWKNLLESSRNTNLKISPLILSCEKEIRNNQLGSLQYSNSCIVASRYAKLGNNFIKKQYYNNNQQQQQQQQQLLQQPTKDKNNNNNLNWKEEKRKELNEWMQMIQQKKQQL
eukprot:gene2344-2892_t